MEMPRTLYILAVSIFVSSFLLPGNAQADTGPTTFQVLNADGEAAPDATVWLGMSYGFTPREPCRTTLEKLVTTQQGYVEVPVTTGSAQIVWVTLPNHAAAYWSAPSLPEDKILRLQPPFYIEGRVTLADERTPAKAARISMDLDNAPVMPVVLSGADGSYQFPGVTENGVKKLTGVLSASSLVDGNVHLGYVRMGTNLVASSDQIVLDRPPKFSGRVMDSSGAPIAQATLEFRGIGPVGLKPVNIVTCDEKGGFIIDRFIAWNFVVRAPGYQTMVLFPTLDQNGVLVSEGLEVRLPKSVKVKGQVVQPRTGKPAKGFSWVRFSQTSNVEPGGDLMFKTGEGYCGVGNPYAEVAVDADGRFEAVLPVGNLSVDLMGPFSPGAPTYHQSPPDLTIDLHSAKATVLIKAEGESETTAAKSNPGTTLPIIAMVILATLLAFVYRVFRAARSRTGRREV